MEMKAKNGMRCPRCGSKDIEHEHTMIDRGHAICHVDYYECDDCDYKWEPPRMVDIRVDLDGNGLRVPSGTVIRVHGPRTDVRGVVEYLDDYHFMFRGMTYHKDQFASWIRNNHLTVTPGVYRGAERYWDWGKYRGPAQKSLRAGRPSTPNNRVEIDYHLKSGKPRTVVIPVDHRMPFEPQLRERHPGIYKRYRAGDIDDERWYFHDDPFPEKTRTRRLLKGGKS